MAMLRSAMPELSDDPTPEQVNAWVELAELVQDPDFKASVRRRNIRRPNAPTATSRGCTTN
jgi:hypothetical protein